MLDFGHLKVLKFLNSLNSSKEIINHRPVHYALSGMYCHNDKGIGK